MFNSVRDSTCGGTRKFPFCVRAIDASRVNCAALCCSTSRLQVQVFNFVRVAQQLSRRRTSLQKRIAAEARSCWRLPRQ
jgi:hypothetical protein